MSSAPAGSERLGWQPGSRAGLLRLGVRGGVLVGAVAMAWWVALGRGVTGLSPFDTEAWERARRFVDQLLGVGFEGTPAFSSWASWQDVLAEAGSTVTMSVLGAAIAGWAALLTLPLLEHRWWAVPAKLAYLVTRSVPELVWALLIVFVFRPGLFAGALALGIHNFGVLGRLSTDLVEDLDPAPNRALRSSGAGSTAVIAYGSLPRLVPQMLTFLLYRWEVIIRATVVVGFVTGAGLGRSLRLALSGRRFTEVLLVMLVYIGLVLVVDAVSAALRRLVR